MKLVLVRHGQSESNLKNLFTGWADPRLTECGIKQARTAGQMLKQLDLDIKSVHTSLLTRTNETTFYLLDEMEQLYLPVHQSWRLNGRHYGALEGQNKDAMREKYGEDLVQAWRRSFDVRPPVSEMPIIDRRYRLLDDHILPQTESLKDTRARLIPYWTDHIAPEIKSGKNVLVVSHGNLLRAFTMFLEDIAPDKINQTEIATAEPIVYEISQDLQITDKTTYHREK
ncbi:MAG: 2,3-diphosphoglycerate-dependent phosphoglycerate mutase [Aerococcus sp.]|nr:2,3-diphosphoglycerate-dependent phosphoglycerate mutase [Aerococcus sp.]